MNPKTLSVLLILCGLMGCSPLLTGDLQASQKSTIQLLEQQSERMDMQEEFLAHLAESQEELSSALEKIDRRTRQLAAQLSGSSKEAVAEKGTAGRPERSSETVAGVGAAVESKQIVGRNEWVWVDLLKRNLKARIDTGALSSSLSATELLPFERDGREWIRFRVPDEDHPDGGDLYEVPLVKYVQVRQASSDKLERRPVVRLTVRLGDFIDGAEFSLTNREDMLYPILLGRNFLRDVALVDVARKFTQPKYVPDHPVPPKESVKESAKKSVKSE